MQTPESIEQKLPEKHIKSGGNLKKVPPLFDSVLGTRTHLTVKVRYRLGSRNC